MNFKILFLLFIISLYSCVDRTFDVPPVKELSIPFNANASVEKLKSYYVAGKYIDITEDLNIVGIVIADDKSGNFYKTLIVQDSTAGIIFKLDRVGIFANYPQGSKIGIKCKGLTIGDYGGLIQVGKGTSIVNGKTQLSFIPDLEISNFLFQGSRNQIMKPRKITINNVRSQDLSTLVQLDNVEFDRTNVGRTLANVGGSSYVDLNITDCNNSKMLLHTSDFADFAVYAAPIGNGSIVAVLGKFNTSIQLYLRDTSEIDFKQTPCNNVGNEELVSVKSIRDLFSGSPINISKNYFIRGIVVSDNENGNVNVQNLFLQDATAGIALRFTSAHTFKLGQEIEVNIYNQELSEFNGLLQLNNLPITNCKLSNSGIIVAPKVINISDLTNNFDSYESSLVRINNVKLSKSSDGTFEFNVIADDKSGTINLFTNSKATFAKELFPTNNVDLIAIASEFNGRQILLRNLNDIIGVNGGGATLKDIQFVRALYQGSTINISDDIFIRATVISERSAMNITGQNMIVMDNKAGITIRFNASHLFNIGDVVEINIKGQELSKFNGLLQINNVPLNNAKFISSGNIINPINITIAEIVSNLDLYEGQLVYLPNVKLSKTSGLTFSGACLVTDSSGSIELFTRSQANFSGDAIPTTSVNITAIVTQFNKAQLMIRTLDDVKP